MEFFGVQITPWIAIPMIYFLWVSLLMIVKQGVFGSIRAFASKTKTQLDDVFLNALDFPLLLIIFSSGGAVIERFLPLLIEASLTKYFLVGFKATTIVAIIIFADKLITGLIKTYAPRIDLLKHTSGIAQGIVRAIVLGLGLLIILDNFGVSITPILASLGVGSLAVALALQPTLENLFAGVQLIVDQPIRVGQFIKLDSGEEGYVTKVGWRSTWVQMLPNNTVVIPNKVLVNSRVTNYYYPNTELAILVQMGVHYKSDLEHVERVTMEVGKEIMQTVEGAVAEFVPFIRYHTFDNSSINFTVILRAKEFVAGYLIKHEFIKRVHKRYAQEGINIPFPIRAINLDQENAHLFLNNKSQELGEK